MTDTETLLQEAIGIAQRLRRLHEKHTCAPGEVGSVIAELDDLRLRMAARAVHAQEQWNAGARRADDTWCLTCGKRGYGPQCPTCERAV